MIWIIDRIEENVAVCEYETGKTIDVPLSALPENIKEGSVISLSQDKSQETQRKEKIDNLMNQLFKD